MKTWFCLMMSICLFIGLDVQAQRFEDYVWKNRVIAVEGLGRGDDRVDEQLKILEQSWDLIEDLKLKVLIVTTSETTIMCAVDGESTVESKLMYMPFTVKLYGLDGGLKKTWDDLVTMAEIEALINTMPMRRSELRKKNKN